MQKRTMNKKISIKTDNPAIYGLLNFDLPYGVQIVSESPYKGGGFNLSRTTDIQIVADFTKIEKDNFVAWLISRTRLFEGNHMIKINRQQIPVNNSEAVELLIKEIEDEE
jgi:hypothetical protein